jgi:myo-inositol 2-dehydrogenase/D-chiro-inositol 1-dehydrogenase
MIAHCRRYDPEWGAIAKVVQSGRLGSPILWRHVLACVGPRNWFMDDKLGGGPLIDGAVHTYDYANYMFGKPDTVLSSSIKLNRKLTATDTGSAVVRYKSGNQLMISWSWAVTSGGQQVFDLIGSRGGLSAGPGDLKTPKAEKGRYGYHTVHDLKGNRRLVKFRVHPRVGLMYINQAKHFLACMQGKAKCETPGNVAIGGVAVAEAILKAGKTGSARKVTW